MMFGQVVSRCHRFRLWPPGVDVCVGKITSASMPTVDMRGGGKVKLYAVPRRIVDGDTMETDVEGSFCASEGGIQQLRRVYYLGIGSVLW